MRRTTIFVIFLTLISLGVSLVNCSPSPDAQAMAAVKEALSGKPGWHVEDLTITVEELKVTVAGEVGSFVIIENLSKELQKLVDTGVITSFQNNCTVLDVTNPLMQDYTVPSLAF
jgi:hypothetical protein